MAEIPAGGSGRDPLNELESLGSGSAFAEQIFALVGRSQFFAEFSREDVAQLAAYMQFYRAQAQQVIIREGEIGDYMLMIVQGEVDIYKTNMLGDQQHMTSVAPGATLGEMSMIDGAPRFATCVAVTGVTFGVLTRGNMVRIIVDNPSLGAKLLIKLVTMLSQRLRQTSAKLLQYMKSPDGL